MKYLLLLLLTTNILLPAFAQEREEFNGPFDGWGDVKTRFGARGNGKDDDTKAFQRALDSLSNPIVGYNTGKNAYMVLYVPAGTYCISSTLTLKGKIGICIIGEDPAKTILKWTGSDGDTMFWANGSAYFKLSRFTWNANGRKNMEAVGIHWKDQWKDAQSQSFAALNIELSDNYFIGGFKYGISGGTGGGVGTGANDSEITIRRCLFESCTEAGIYINGFNALDYWIWDSRFTNCKIAINCIKGNYHVYRSYFSGSRVWDMYNDNCYYLSVRGCYSRNANGFSGDCGYSSNPFKRVFQDNTVVSPQNYAVEYYHLGKVTLWDNRFEKLKDTSKHFWVSTGSWAIGIYENMSLDNTYGVRSPLVNNRTAMTNFVVNDKFASSFKDDAPAFLATLSVTPPKVTRKIFEVRTGAKEADIQTAIDQASALHGSRAVVHLAAGTYSLDRPLHIPAGSDIQLCGDGLIAATRLMPGPAYGMRPMLWIEGPTTADIHDLQIGEPGAHLPGTAILFTNVDQPEAEAHIDQLDSRADTSLFTNRLNNLYTEKDNSFFSNGTCIIGGNNMQSGAATAKVCCFGAQFVNTSVRNGGVFMAKDCWWEGNMTTPLDFTGDGNISIDGAMVARARLDSTPSVRINNFSGKISIMNMYLHGAIAPGNGLDKLSLLIWNVHVMDKLNPLDFFNDHLPYKAAFLGLTTQCFQTGNKICDNIYSIPDKTTGVNLPSFLEDMTSLTRHNKPVKYRNLPATASNIYISRVTIGTFARGIVLSNQ